MALVYNLFCVYFVYICVVSAYFIYLSKKRNRKKKKLSACLDAFICLVMQGSIEGLILKFFQRFLTLYVHFYQKKHNSDGQKITKNRSMVTF